MSELILNARNKELSFSASVRRNSGYLSAHLLGEYSKVIRQDYSMTYSEQVYPVDELLFGKSVSKLREDCLDVMLDHTPDGCELFLNDDYTDRVEVEVKDCYGHIFVLSRCHLSLLSKSEAESQGYEAKLTPHGDTFSRNCGLSWPKLCFSFPHLSEEAGIESVVYRGFTWKVISAEQVYPGVQNLKSYKLKKAK